MNLLAHIYLSGEEDLVKTGNFIGDHVKGNRFKIYRPLLQKGILLHRTIDTYTDHHSLPIKVSKLLRPFYRKYSGIVVDVFYDHFLSVNWDEFSDIPLNDFVEDFHQVLKRNYHILPLAVQSFVPRLIEQKRLLSYRETEGVNKALQIMAKYTSLPEQTNFAMDILKNHYDFIGNTFIEFFPQLIDHVREKHRIQFRYSFDSSK